MLNLSLNFKRFLRTSCALLFKNFIFWNDSNSRWQLILFNLLTKPNKKLVNTRWLLKIYWFVESKASGWRRECAKARLVLWRRKPSGTLGQHPSTDPAPLLLRALNKHPSQWIECDLVEFLLKGCLRGCEKQLLWLASHFLSPQNKSDWQNSKET